MGFPVAVSPAVDVVDRLLKRAPGGAEVEERFRRREAGLPSVASWRRVR